MNQHKPPKDAFAERSERLDLHLPLAFVSEDQEIVGHCVNVSGTGMLAVFAHPLELWVTGTVSILAGEHYLTLPVRVARTQNRDAGFSFLLQTENDRRAIAILLEAAAALALSQKVQTPPLS